VIGENSKSFIKIVACASAFLFPALRSRFFEDQKTTETLPTADDRLAGKGKRIADIAGPRRDEGFRDNLPGFTAIALPRSGLVHLFSTRFMIFTSCERLFAAPLQ
jgi:hypothetical protein